MRRTGQSMALVICGICLAAVAIAGSRLTSAEPERPQPAESKEKPSSETKQEQPLKGHFFGGSGGRAFGGGGGGGGFGGAAFGQYPFSPYISSRRLIVVADNDKHEVKAYSSHSGAWQTQAFPAENNAQAFPTVSDDLAAFCIGDTCYAFSGITGRWDSVTVEKDPKEFLAPTVSFHFATCTAKNRLYVFSAEQGNWSSTDLPRVEPQKADTPARKE